MIYPAGFEQKIGFDRIREMLAHLCMSTSGRDLADQIHFLTDPSVLVPELDRTAEMREICLFEQKFPESGYEDTLSFLRQMEVQ
ncbi:MAG: hypothetical protein PHE35_09155, partial [Bacteroidales bacterium]|nr:hypothetical protein [Bacteroidales bacterium]